MYRFIKREPCDEINYWQISKVVGRFNSNAPWPSPQRRRVKSCICANKYCSHKWNILIAKQQGPKTLQQILRTVVRRRRLSMTIRHHQVLLFLSYSSISDYHSRCLNFQLPARESTIHREAKNLHHLWAFCGTSFPRPNNRLARRLNGRPSILAKTSSLSVKSSVSWWRRRNKKKLRGRILENFHTNYRQLWSRENLKNCFHTTR